MTMPRGLRIRDAELKIQDAILSCGTVTLALQEFDEPSAEHFKAITKDMRVYLDLWRKRQGIPGQHPRLPNGHD